MRRKGSSELAASRPKLLSGGRCDYRRAATEGPLASCLTY